MYKGQVHALEDHEIDELLEVAEGHTERTELTVRGLLRTGMRASEFAHLRDHWLLPNKEVPRIQVPSHEPCDCSDCKMKARQAGDTDDLEPKIREWWKPKSEAGARQVPVVHDRAWEMLEDFVGRHGGINVGRGAIWSRVEKLNDDLDLDEPLTPHILRHTYGTWMVRNGVGIETLQRVLGHANIQNTQVYLHLTGDRVAESVSDAVNG
jgi:site-specific recombinase XerD